MPGSPSEFVRWLHVLHEARAQELVVVCSARPLVQPGVGTFIYRTLQSGSFMTDSRNPACTQLGVRLVRGASALKPCPSEISLLFSFSSQARELHSGPGPNAVHTHSPLMSTM